MAGLFSRIRTWIKGDTMQPTDVNAEFNNIITNLAADKITGASNYPATVAGMQAQTNPGGVGTEVLPTTIQDEFREIRYQLAAITGNTYWYSAPAATLASLATSITGLYTTPASRIVSGRKDANNQPMFLVPNGAAATVVLKATSTNLVAYINGTSRTVSADVTLTGLSTAPSSNNTCAVNDSALAGSQATKTQGERATFITIGTIGSEISALNGKYAAFKKGTEYFIAEVDTSNNRLRNCFRGVGFDSTDAWLARVTLSDTNTITLMKLSWLFLTYSAGTFSLSVTYNKPTVSYAQPSGPAIGDYWLDITNATWKQYNGTSFASVEAVFAGIAIQDSSNCVAARSVDFFKVFNPLNTMEMEYVSASSVRANRLGSRVSSYGTTYYFDNTQPSFSTSTNLDSGVALSASTSYYCYITDLGDVKISDVAPTERKFDLLGAYHPAKPWRSVGEFATDGSSNIISSGVSIAQHYGILLPPSIVIPPSVSMSNFSFKPSVASNTLTIALKDQFGNDPSSSSPVQIWFRSSTLASGSMVLRTVTAPLSVTISNGSTLGHASGANSWIHVYFLDNAGAVALGVATSPYLLDEGSRVSTTAEGGAGAADSYNVMYSTAALTNVAGRLACRLKSNQATAGTWASAPSEVANWPFTIQPVICQVERITSVQTITSGSDTKVQFNQKTKDVYNTFDATTNYRFTSPGIGWLSVRGHLEWATANASGRALVYLYKNGSEIRRVYNSRTGTANVDWGIPFTFDEYVSAVTDYFEIYTQQATGVNQDIRNANAGTFACFDFKGKIE